MRIHVEVTQEDMDAAALAYGDAGNGLWTQCCPIAQALCREHPGYDWRVDPRAGRNVWIGGGYDKGSLLPTPARKFGDAWDRNYRHPSHWPKPVSFDIDLPVEVTA